MDRNELVKALNVIKDTCLEYTDVVEFTNDCREDCPLFKNGNCAVMCQAPLNWETNKTDYNWRALK